MDLVHPVAGPCAGPGAGTAPAGATRRIRRHRPELLLEAMARRQTRVVDLEMANLRNPGTRQSGASTPGQPSPGRPPAAAGAPPCRVYRCGRASRRDLIALSSLSV